MNSSSLDKGFESFRRERQRRRLDSGTPRRPLGENAEVLRQLEQAEAAEVHDERLTREVHDFFAGATKTAAEIVAKMAEDLKERSSEQIDCEMEQFLMDTLRRMEHFVQTIQVRKDPNIGEQILETDLHNIVGQKLDAFRHEGTAQLTDKHIGQDPFLELDEAPAPEQPVYQAPAEAPAQAEGESDWHPVSSADDEVDEVDAMLADRLAGSEPEPQPAPAEPAPAPAPVDAQAAHGSLGGRANQFLLQGIADDPQRLREALKLLVQGGVMSKDEALEIYRNSARNS